MIENLVEEEENAGYQEKVENACVHLCMHLNLYKP